MKLICQGVREENLTEDCSKGRTEAETVKAAEVCSTFSGRAVVDLAAAHVLALSGHVVV